MVKSKVKYIQSLSHKKQRDADSVFVAEGPKIVNELLGGGIEPVALYATAEWRPSSPHATVEVIDATMLERISYLSTPNQVLGVFKKPSQQPFHLADTVSLMADNIQDPGNLGTIIRCADWFGIKQVICSRECADVFGPKTIQSTMGSIARVNVYYEDLEEVITAHPSTPVFAATLDGTNIHQLKPIHHGVILIGNESKGIQPKLLSLVQERITIPRIGGAESLNAAVATGIILSHLIKSSSPSHNHS